MSYFFTYTNGSKFLKEFRKLTTEENWTEDNWSVAKHYAAGHTKWKRLSKS